jgi:hypothetical protein
LAFHLYPQLISHFCNSEEFGPPRGITLASPWPWVAHPVSGLLLATERPIQTRFRYGSACQPLNLATKSNSLAHSPKGTRSGIPEGCKHLYSGIALPLLVSTRFQVLFHSGHPGSFHLSLTVLVHYRSPRVFSLGKWASLLPTGLACPVVLKVNDGSLIPFTYGGITLCALPFQCSSARDEICNSPGSLQQSQSCLTTPISQRLQS